MAKQNFTDCNFVFYIYLKLLRIVSIHRRSTFFLIIADFGCARLRCSYGIWLLFPMAIKEKLTPATKSDILELNELNHLYPEI